MISGKALIAGVMGDPVAHSLSPRLHGYWIERYGIDGAYIPLHVKQTHLADAVKGAFSMGFRGFNVTLPHKEAMMLLMDECDGDARRTGAVNTVTIDAVSGRISGTNTDVYGFAQNLRQTPGYGSLRKNSAMVIGAGGAARACVAALQDEGFASITLINRNRARAEQIAEALGGAIRIEPWERRHDALAGVALLVNATSLGMAGQPELDLSLDALPRDAWVSDIVYRPLMTPLLQQAASRGYVAVAGLDMLIYQAQKGFHLWYGALPEVDDALRRHLQHL